MRIIKVCHQSNMKHLFIKELLRHMGLHENIWFLTGDLGYGTVEPIRDQFPKRFINCGSSEQAMLDIAVGLALEKQIPFVYSITPFLLYRPFESIRNYLNHEGIAVKLIGVGRNVEYGKLGFSHHSYDDRDILDSLENIFKRWPTKGEIPELVDECIHNNVPYYINLSKKI